MMKIGILALQGDFQSHAERLTALNQETLLIKRAPDLDLVHALVLPGGESTTLLTLLEQGFKEALSEKISKGLPILATCAGLIVIADRVHNPEQESLKLLNVGVSRNAYGRQVNSFIAPDLHWTAVGERLNQELSLKPEKIEAVFIRAPKIDAVSSGVEILIEHEKSPVLIRQRNILAATFHPELSAKTDSIYRLFFRLITDFH